MSLAHHVCRSQTHCREREVVCEFCSAVILAKNLDAHKAATCPQLRLCRCGAHVLRSMFAEHKSTDCAYRMVTVSCAMISADVWS